MGSGGILKVYVSPGLAVKAGRMESGELAIAVADEMVAKLNQEQRDWLARYVADPIHYQLGRRTCLSKTNKMAQLKEATWGAVVEAINHELAEQALIATNEAAELAEWQRLQQENELVRERSRKELDSAAATLLSTHEVKDWLVESEIDPDRLVVQVDIGDYMLREHQAVQAAMKVAQAEADRLNALVEQQKKEKEAEYLKALAAWVETFGSAELKLALTAGTLREPDALEQLRMQLFAPLDTCVYRYMQISKRSVKDCQCTRQSDTSRAIKFDAQDVELNPGAVSGSTRVFLTLNETMRLEELKTLVPTGYNVRPRVHFAWCEYCFQHDQVDGEVRRASVLITVDWHGRPLSREYALSVVGD